MTHFAISDPKTGVTVAVPFEAFLDLVKSSSVVSAATSESFFEIGTSENVNVRFDVIDSGELLVTMFSTVNEGSIPQLRLQIADGKELVSAADVEQRIRSLRQSYAIAFMVEARRTVELARALGADPDSDIEKQFLNAKERLYIGSMTPGSMWITVVAQTMKAYKVLRYGLALPFEEGRTALIDRVRADTRLQQLAVDEKEVDVDRKRYASVIDTAASIEKISDPDMRALIKSAFVQNLSQASSDRDVSAKTGKEQEEWKPSLTEAPQHLRITRTD